MYMWRDIVRVFRFNQYEYHTEFLPVEAQSNNLNMDSFISEVAKLYQCNVSDIDTLLLDKIKIDKNIMSLLQVDYNNLGLYLNGERV